VSDPEAPAPGHVPTISLIGMPGVGKSTIGRHVARRIGSDFVDTDTVIERRLGEPIRSFFERHGEARFREIESEVLAQCVAGPGVIATGGGIVLSEANRGLLRSRTTCLYLRAKPEDLFRRLRHDSKRPLLQVADPLAKLRELYAVRDPLYRLACHFELDVGHGSMPSLLSRVVMQLELAGLVD
jgi:shikimate kinase